MDIKVEEIELDRKETLEKDKKSDKVGILDIRAKINNGIQCDIEMQVLDKKILKNGYYFIGVNYI